MTDLRHMRSLGTLLDLRARELDRLGAELADKAALRARFHANLARLQGLCDADVAPAAPPWAMAMAVNHAGYKQALLRKVDEHRQDLALHEADMAVTQRALTAAAHQHEVLGQVLAQRRELARREQARCEQKRQDDLAAQVWWRGQA